MAGYLRELVMYYTELDSQVTGLELREFVEKLLVAWWNGGTRLFVWCLHESDFIVIGIKQLWLTAKAAAVREMGCGAALWVLP